MEEAKEQSSYCRNDDFDNVISISLLKVCLKLAPAKLVRKEGKLHLETGSITAFSGPGSCRMFCRVYRPGGCAMFGLW